MKKDIKIILYCPKCKKTPSIDKEQSTKHWNVILAKCPTCKKQLKIKVI